MADKKKVCKDCGALNEEKVCSVCGGKNLTDKYKGTIVIIDAQGSEIAQKHNFKKNGIYAFKY